MKFFKNNDGKGMLILGCDCAIEAPNGYVELTANTTDAAQEKHVPIVKMEGDSVFVDEIGRASCRERVCLSV